MKIAFRTDASNRIGTGHFMRCLTLADELKKQGAQIRFISRNLPAYLSDMLNVKGIEYMPLNAETTQESTDEIAHADWLGTSQLEDAQASIEALSKQVWDWIVVDHYALDEAWESMVRVSCKKLMVIDDLADRKHDCDVLLDQNFYANMQTRYSGKVPAHCQLLFGLYYALLRAEFGELRKKIEPRTGAVKKILVLFGGVDVNNYTSLAIKALAKLDIKQQVDVVIGAQHPKRKQIQKSCAQYGFICHVQTDRMAELMSEADLAIGAGGGSTWERCCLGLPTITICIAENQRQQISDAAEAGLLYELIGDEHNLVDVIRDHLKSLLEAPSLTRLISQTGMKLVDGRGSLRVAGVIEASSIKIRLAVKSDLKNLFDWRNDLKIRNSSRNSDPILWEDHQRWFNTVLANKKTELIIGSIGNKTVGVVRFDMEDSAAEVSIYLVPNGGFSGLGRHLLLSAEEWLKRTRPEIRIIRACVLGENKASKSLFMNSNYVLNTIGYSKKI
jgi:UDP-2,4-diacetamido-2,4,6-trideoxy-beta-L-altropyranose hydrolase